MCKRRTIWSDAPEGFREQIASRLEGPYEELLDAILYLNKKISNVDTAQASSWLALEEQLFGDPTSLFQEKIDLGLGFSASLMDGPYVDVLQVAGLPSTDMLSYGVWENANWITLLQCCPSVCIEEQESIDEVPGQSDTFYWCEIEAPRVFARELRVAMLTIASGQST